MASEVIYRSLVTDHFHRHSTAPILDQKIFAPTSQRKSFLLPKEYLKITDRSRSINFPTQLATSKSFNGKDRKTPAKMLLPPLSSNSKSSSLNRLDLTLKLDHISKNRSENPASPSNTGTKCTKYLTCSSRVANALKHTENQRDICFYRGSLRRLRYDLNDTSAPDSSSNVVRSINTTDYLSARNYGARFEKSDNVSLKNPCALSELSGEESIKSSETCSISLVPGVFGRDRQLPARIFVKYRQLSTDEWVLEWLFKYCTHPSSSLPLL